MSDLESSDSNFSVNFESVVVKIEKCYRPAIPGLRLMSDLSSLKGGLLLEPLPLVRANGSLQNSSRFL